MNYPTLDDIFPLLQQGHPYADYLAGRCPFHNDSSPSLLVNPRGYRCQACGAHGSLSKLYAKLTGQPIRIVQDKKKFSWKSGAFNIWMEAAATLRENLDLAKYLTHDRGIDIDTVLECQIGYWEGWYIFPIFKDEEFMGAVARPGSVIESSYERFSNSPGEATLYAPNENRHRPKNYLLVPFGILDAISLYHLGYPAATWISGKFVPSSAFDSYRVPIYFIPDKGEEKEARRVAGELGWRGRVVLLDYGDKKDPNDFLKAKQDSLLQKQIERALE